MSARVRERAHVIRQVADRKLGQRRAAELLGVGVRQVKRLVASYRRRGDRGLGVGSSWQAFEQPAGATGRLTGLLFAASETTRGYLEVLRSHVLAHGVPLALYSDRHGIFRVNAKEVASGAAAARHPTLSERLMPPRRWVEPFACCEDMTLCNAAATVPRSGNGELKAALASRIFAALRHQCDIIYTFCLPNAQRAPSLSTLMIISTLRVGPRGPLFFFWDVP